MSEPTFKLDNASYRSWLSICSWEVRSGSDHLEKVHAMLNAVRALDGEAADEVVREALHFLTTGHGDQREFAAWILQALAPREAVQEVAAVLPLEGHTQVRLTFYLLGVLGEEAHSLAGVREVLATWDHPPHFSSLPAPGIWY
jgi:hypothetical protein